MSTHTPNWICGDVSKKTPPGGPTREWQTHLRGIVRLLQCPACWLPLNKPVTLPCGKSFCQSCLPEPHKRQNISWPGTAERQWGIRCPNIECGREHAQEDYSLDIMLRHVVEAVDAVMQNQGDSPKIQGLHTQIIFDDPPKIIIDDPPVPLWTIMKGGVLLAAYNLAEEGELKRSSSPEFISPGDNVEITRAFDEELLAQIRSAVREELNCEICRIGRLINPLTTSCGHTFCEMCLYRSLYLANDNTCPSCRRRLSLRFGSKPALRPDVLNGFLQYMDEAAEDDLTKEAKRETWGCISEERPILFVRAIFPCISASIQIPEHLRPMIRRAIQEDKILAVCTAVLNGQSTVGTLVHIMESHRFETLSRIRVAGLSRFRVSSATCTDAGYMLAKIRPLDDISLAEEEDYEVQETAGTTDKNVIKSKEDIHRVSTKCLSGLATHVLHRCLNKGKYSWLARSSTSSQLRHPGQYFPYDPVKLPWWFASVAPISDVERFQLLVRRSVRERLQMCWLWMFDLGLAQFGLESLEHS